MEDVNDKGVNSCLHLRAGVAGRIQICGLDVYFVFRGGERVMDD